MKQNKNMNLLDYLVLLVKWKKFFIILVLSTAVISYLFIYFFVESEYEASAVILPVEQNKVSGISSLLKNVSNLPIGIPSGMNEELNLYSTIVDSRTVLQKVIDKFNLIDVFKIDRNNKEYFERTLKALRNSIDTKISEEQVFKITVTMPSPKLASEVTNYIVQLLNSTIVELDISKSKNNRVFLEERLEEVKNNLRNSEDSLQIYQEKSGILDAKEQIKGIISAYSNLETQLISKQIEYSIYQKIFDKDSPKIKNLKIELDEYQDKLQQIKSEGQKDSYLMALNTLPRKATNYLRHYRNVEINSKVLEFLVPLYEQAKFDEQKDVPILQVLDSAIPPAKKSFPPRALLTLLVCFAVFIIGFFYVLIQENDNWKKSEKIIYIKNNLFKWKEK